MAASLRSDPSLRRGYKSASCGKIRSRHSRRHVAGSLAIFLLLLVDGWASTALLGGVAASSALSPEPRHVHLRAAVFTNTVPLAYYVEEPEETFPFANFQGYQPDLLREVQRIALEVDNVTLSFDVEIAPGLSDYAPNLFYDQSLNYIADDCNTTEAVANKEDCNRFDLYVADYYAIADRSVRVLFTPAMLTTAAVAVKYAHRSRRDISTIEEATALNESTCLLVDSFYDTLTIQRHPNAAYIHCHSHGQCIGLLKEEKCALFVEDELQLKHLAKHDPDLVFTREQFNEQFVAWPLNKRLMDLDLQVLFVKWIYHAKASGVMDALYNKYFSIDFCPVGKAGTECSLPCSPSHGIADRYGACVCESTKWTGGDCSIEVMEDKNMIPKGLLYACYAMVAVNMIAVSLCVWWLWRHRHRAQVKASQPSFLLLVLLGCLISTSTILAFAQEDEGDGPVPACMGVPWLYSIGFCITFGTLFAKIRRVYRVFKNAAQMRRIHVSFKETAAVVGIVLAIDVTILTIWTLVDPLSWQRLVTSEDKYGEALSSEGYCTSDYWEVFASILAVYHFLLLAVACYMCYLTRDLPARFADSKYVAMAMFSNLQVFVVGVPVLIILGAEPGTSFFVRSVMVFINDFVVVSLIFGNLIYAVHQWDSRARLASHPRSSQACIQSDIQVYAKHIRESSELSSKTSLHHTSGHHHRNSGASRTEQNSEQHGKEQQEQWNDHYKPRREAIFKQGIAKEVSEDDSTNFEKSPAHLSALSEEMASFGEEETTSHLGEDEGTEQEGHA